MTSHPSDPLEPITPWRATCNRLVLDEAVRAYERRHGRTSRRQSARTQDPSAALATEAITKGEAA